MKILKYYIVAVLYILALCSCHNESNPAVPGDPEGDITSIVERNPLVRVGLVSFTPQKHVFISINRGEFKCFVGESLQEFASGIGGDVIKISGTDDMLEYTLEDSEEAVGVNNTVMRIEVADTTEGANLLIGPSSSALRPYRGSLRLYLEGKNVLAVNELPLEEYLYGVVPAEMDASWPEEALLTQAIVSRTYAIFHLNANDNRGFDLRDDSRNQLYGGISVETDATTNAVIDTNSSVITYENSLAAVVFHHESGGLTADDIDVWPFSGNLPYLEPVSDDTGVVDFSSGGEYESWSNYADFEELHTAFNLDGETFVGDYFSAITILNVSDNGRIRSIDIQGEKNPVVDAITLMQVLNRRIREDFLPSNNFVMTLEENGYRFTGSGKGHGVGLSQWGTYKRALNTQTHEQIIEHYFPGCEITEIPLGGVEVIHNTKVDTLL